MCINNLTDNREVVKKSATSAVTVHIIELYTYRIDIEFISESYIIDKFILSILHKVEGIDALEIFVVTIPNEVISIFILKAISSGSKRGICYLQHDIIFAVGGSIFTLNTKLIARRDSEFVTTPEEDIDRGFIIFETTYTDNEFTGCHAPIFIELAGKIGKIGSFEKVGKLG